MKKYQMWGFTYLTKERGQINIINGSKEENEYDYIIPCFDGCSFFYINGKYYIAKYPKYNELTPSQRDQIVDYCGYNPNDGEYGVIMGALGKIHEIDYDTFLSLCSEYLSIFLL